LLPAPLGLAETAFFSFDETKVGAVPEGVCYRRNREENFWNFFKKKQPDLCGLTGF
jgi:hypothetical protein